MSFVLRRLGFYLVAFFVAATINFAIPRLMPGDPVAMMFAKNEHLTEDNIAALRKTFGFVDGPLIVQYLTYLKSVATGDFGLSIKFFPTPVTAVLARALTWTLVLVGGATLISFLIGRARSFVEVPSSLLICSMRRPGCFDTNDTNCVPS